MSDLPALKTNAERFSGPSVIGSPLRRIVRLSLYALVTLALIPVQAAFVALRLPLAARLPRLYHRICLFLLGVQLEVHGEPSRERPTLFVGNHASYLDITLYGALLNASFVAKSEIAQWPFFGWLAKLQRSVFVDRRRVSSHDQRRAIEARLKAGDSLILFPEGTSDDGLRLLPFRSALLSAAELTVGGRPVTVQPVSLAYARLDGIALGRHLMPFFAWYGAMEMPSHLWRLVGLGRLTAIVVFHAPVTLAQFKDRKALAEHCFRAVAEGHSQALFGRAR